LHLAEQWIGAIPTRWRRPHQPVTAT